LVINDIDIHTFAVRLKLFSLDKTTKMPLYRNILQEELKIFEQKFTESVKSSNRLIDNVMKYVVKRKGKQLRPVFVLLSAKLFGNINESSYRAASLVELLHTATLVHDDVVDDSNQRRGFFSINALWKNKIAVLVGDYLLSKGLILSLSNKEFKILEIFTTAVREMSEGELIQMEKSRSLNITEQIYYEIIKGKTASLISSCCAAGAFSTTQNDETALLMKNFGEKIGMAFQIRDDLFDYTTNDVGKPTGNDIKERKLTLPLIYTLNNCSLSEKIKIKLCIRLFNTNKKKVAEVIEIVQKVGGIRYAEEKMEQYKKEALAILHSFEQNDARDALEELVHYTTNRTF
jgi:octaprenyl-diphosphate synthase